MKIFEYETVEDGIGPKKAKPDDAGFDVFCRKDERITSNTIDLIPVGFKVSIPKGWEIQLRPKSGLALKGLKIHFGTIDSGYCDEVCVIVHNPTDEDKYFQKGQKIAQIVPKKIPDVMFERVIHIDSDNDRGGGFGSTGE